MKIQIGEVRGVSRTTIYRALGKFTMAKIATSCGVTPMTI